MRTLYLILKTARPRQWMKNLALFAALIFNGFFFFQPSDGPAYFWIVSYAFLIFCLLTSAVYIMNDIIDVQADRKHPFKKNRPIASGDLSIKTAIVSIIILLILIIILTSHLSIFFNFLLLIYFILQFVYAKKTKHIPVFDVLSIATGFLIRVYAGAVAVNLSINVWFLLTVISASLFLAVGKRQSERTLMKDKIGPTRSTLKIYSQRLLDQYTSMFANATWLTYALFTFQTKLPINPAHERFTFIYSVLPRTWQSKKLLMLTLPLVIIAVMRYLLLVYEENRGESPEMVLVKDKTLLTTVFTFGIMVMLIIYL